MAASREPFSFNVTGRSPETGQQQHSPWHSPVPYLFGGLAAMLGLIAFALLILACSYWKLSGYLDGGINNREADLEAGEGKGEDTQKPVPSVFEEKILVIMAGEDKPTYLATPMTSRASSFGDTKSSGGDCEMTRSNKSLEVAHTLKNSAGDGDHSDQLRSENRSQTHEESDRSH